MARVAGVIGMVHFKPLVGSDSFESEEAVQSAAAADAEALQTGGVDAIMFENNYDLPHRVTLTQEAADMFFRTVSRVASGLDVPFGACALWNDYRLALQTVEITGGSFVRIPVFVDSVQTDFGLVEADSADVIAARADLASDTVALLADVHVKHANLLHPRSLADSTAASVMAGANGLIVTGQWTADRPSTADLETVAQVSGEASVIVGSGATAENVATLRKHADGVIVGTALKAGGMKDVSQERNVTSSEQRIDPAAVQRFMKSWQAVT